MSLLGRPEDQAATEIGRSACPGDKAQKSSVENPKQMPVFNSIQSLKSTFNQALCSPYLVERRGPLVGGGGG